MSQPGILRAIIAGIVATLIMTFVMYRLPIIGYPAIDIISFLSAFSPYFHGLLPYQISPYMLGSALHLMIGVILAIIYAFFFYFSLPGPNWFKGAVFSFLPWLFVITLLGPSLQFVSRSLRSASSSPSANPCVLVNPCSTPGAGNPRAGPINPCDPQLIKPSQSKLVNPWLPAATAEAESCPQLPSLILHLIYGVVLGVLYRHRTASVKVLR